MRSLLDQIRTDLALAGDTYPWLTQAIAACVLLAPLALMGDGLADVVVSVCAALFLARSLVHRDATWLREPWIAVAGLLWLYLVARGLLSVDPERSGLKALTWIRFAVFAAAVHFVLAHSAAAQRLLLYAFAFMLVFAAADTLFQFVVGHDVFGRPIDSDNRLTGPLRNPAIGLLLLVAGLPALVLFLQRVRDAGSTVSRILPAVAIALVYVALVLSGERMMLLLGIAVFALLVLIVFRPSWRSLLALGLAGLVVVGGVLAAFPQVRERHLSTLDHLRNMQNSVYARAMLAGVEVFKDNPIFGVGLKNFDKHCKQAVEDEGVETACHLIHPHQVWLHIASETGLVGTAGFLAIFALGLWPAIRLWHTWPVEPLLAGATIAALLRLAPFTTSGNFFSNWRECVFWLLFAVAAAMGRVRAASPASAGETSARDTNPTAPRSSPS